MRVITHQMEGIRYGESEELWSGIQGTSDQFSTGFELQPCEGIQAFRDRQYHPRYLPKVANLQMGQPIQ